MAPKLPIQNRSTISPRCKSSPIGPRRHDRRQTRWADYTPTCGAWHEAHSPWPEGTTYAGISSMFLQTPPGHLETSDERAQLWPATPTPSGGGTGYGFGVMERSSETHHGLSGDTHGHAAHAAHAAHLHPPTRVAHLAAAAAHAAAAAKVTVEKAEKVDKVKLGIEALNGLNDAAVHAHDVATAALDEVKEVKTLSKDDKVLPSKGSATHGSGKCRPCAWYWKPQGCQNDKDCGYCHLCPEGELKNRKKSKVAAMRMGALVPASKTHKTKSYSGARVLKLSPLL